jgi:UDP-N-acetylmuramoyl-tripeptide--D-alanyl-D-alanine ligase
VITAGSVVTDVDFGNANKEIYDWAKENNAKVFVNQNHKDLVEDSVEIKKENLIYYAPEQSYKTKLFGNYNFENIALAMKLAEYFDVNINDALMAIENYEPSLKRSETIERDGIKFVVDCYNANPTSMQLALESFLNNTEEKEGENKKALILGDMLELGNYSKEEHEKILKSLEILNKNKNIKTVMLIGENFKNALSQTQTENKPDNNNSENKIKYECFKDSDSAKAWFETQDFSGYTILLKGSRGMRVEKVIGL